MNERIKELAYKAGLHNHLWLDIPDSDDVLDTVKFAELIVKECIDTAFHKGHPDLEFLLKHFGVE